ncbi:Putative GroES-like superfamily, alcohol dehydrogenase-like, NAD(P)-binding domain superfamily [Colletotrichum destructivum]|uniref:GroES-like superfamily, alcohol dehydrogenase-like, NAD(P)-binding domain superfamily n=1 Tax=Colletotrichum destructivum TaxID=34406 RepID=A0AAX4J139_9PEZI|nr:Putative GroES-like superfamily, alcohol dehydrogenase-like, NAD(P)-binding domain superfamily [Colletotrichum destructivum]
MKALVSNRSIAARLFNHSTGKSGFKGAHVIDVPRPKITGQEILVKVKAVALNPSDYKHIDVISPKNCILGCDYAGEVVEVGPSAKTSWKVGDRVAGVVHGGLYHDRGAFAEYLKTEADVAWKIPSGVSDEEAATYGVSAVTAVLALNVHLDIPWPDEAIQSQEPTASTSQKRTILIYGGSTSAGLFAIQLAKRAGYTVVTTASPHSYDLVKRYGADKVFNYRSDNWVKEVSSAYPDITIALDCISEKGSGPSTAQVLKAKGGKIVTLLDQGESNVSGVKYDMIMLYTVFGKEFAWLPPVGPKFPVDTKHRAALVRFYASLPQLTDAIKPPPIQAFDGGIDVLLEKVDLLRQGKVSGTKLVVRF